MKKFLILCFSFALLTTSNISNAKEYKSAKEVVQKAIDEAEVFFKTHTPQETSEKEIRLKLKDMLMEYFEMDYIAKASLGKYWRKTTEKQKQEYIPAFIDSIVKTYSVQYDEYADGHTEIKKISKRSDRDYIVFAIYHSKENAPPLDINWMVRNFGGERYKIIDITVGGISLLITKRNEFEDIIEQNKGDIDILISKLKE